jgi:hypothetical protein
MTDVDHSGITDLIACEKVSPPKTAERDGEVCTRRSVHDAGEEIDPGRAIDGDDRGVEIVNALEEPGNGSAWGTSGSGPEQCVDR